MARRLTQAQLNLFALDHTSGFQHNTLRYLLDRGWNVNRVEQSPSRKSMAVTVHGPSFGLVNPNGFFQHVKRGEKVRWTWSRLDDLAAATVPNYNGLPIEDEDMTGYKVRPA